MEICESAIFDDHRLCAVEEMDRPQEPWQEHQQHQNYSLEDHGGLHLLTLPTQAITF
jgi:hypothetical protein